MSETVVVRVKPGSRKGPLVEAVVKLLATHFGISPSCVKVVSGATSRVKRFRIEQ